MCFRPPSVSQSPWRKRRLCSWLRSPAASAYARGRGQAGWVSLSARPLGLRGGFLRPSSIPALPPASLRVLSTTYLDALEDRAVIDLIGDYAALLPMDVIAKLLGVPDGMSSPAAPM